MDLLWRPKKSQTTGWISNPDGSLEPPVVRIISEMEDGVYEIEICRNISGLELDLNFKHKCAVICSISSDENVALIKSIADIGDILISLNNHVVIEEDFEDIIALNTILREIEAPRRYRLLKPHKCSLAVFLEKESLKQKSDKDIFGFMRTRKYMLAERKLKVFNMKYVIHRDLEWFEYLKAIGGPENLKPAGVFAPSKALKILVRRGIPVAFRPLVWQNISQSSLRRRQYPVDYYSALLRDEASLDPIIASDIEKDVD
eukprot:gene9890-20579_t